MDRVIAIVATLAIGGLVAFQPPANALLARHVGDFGSAFVSLLLSTLIVGTLLLASGQVGRLEGLVEFRPVHLIGGIAGAAVVFGTIITVRHLGAAGVTAALVCTQLGVSALIDRFGAIGVPQIDLSPARLIGIGLLVAGTVLVTTR
ncbi:MAG TPA: DMT family transporter [Solirubrobacteraceae bacterium]|nr:DMT family transporter [Solirubrobacteraceae bacterium]